MAKYWVAVASREHVERGINGSFCQVCHGKETALKKMNQGDWIIYYSPTTVFGQKDSLQKFTAIGQIAAGEPYQFKMSEDFIPFRRDVKFLKSQEVPIKDLLDKLNFTKNKKSWGMVFRRGVFEISQEDFKIIAESMEIKI